MRYESPSIAEKASLPERVAGGGLKTKLGATTKNFASSVRISSFKIWSPGRRGWSRMEMPQLRLSQNPLFPLIFCISSEAGVSERVPKHGLEMMKSVDEQGECMERGVEGVEV